MASSTLVEMADVDSATFPLKDGPVVTMMNKRLRALKKKLNRITQIEEAKSQGKPVNKEQEEVLKSKPQVVALVEEYERLRQPLVAALKEEIEAKEKEWEAAKAEQEHEQVQEQGVVSNGSSDARTESEDVSNEVEVNETETEEEGGEKVQASVEESSLEESRDLDDHLGDLIQMLYFAQLFDVTSTEAWTKYHERNSCLSYDFVTDDSMTPLTEADLGALASFGSLVTSRPPNTTLSHKEALQNCISHARNWLLNAEVPIGGVDMTYTDLRDRLNRILATDYFTMTPELQTVTRHVTGYNEDETYVDGETSNSVENVSDGSANNESFANNADDSQVEETKHAPAENAAEPTAELASGGSSPSEDQAQAVQRQPGANGNGRYKQQGRGGYGRGRGYLGGGRGTGRGRGRGHYDGSYNSGKYYPQQRYYEQGSYAPVGGGRQYEQGGYRASKSQGNSGGGGPGGNGGRRGGRQYSNSNSGGNNNNVQANGRAVAAQSG